jgi:hypothetical protein
MLHAKISSFMHFIATQWRTKEAVNQAISFDSTFRFSVLTRMIMQDRLNVSGKDKSLDGVTA